MAFHPRRSAVAMVAAIVGLHTCGGHGELMQEMMEKESKSLMNFALQHIVAAKSEAI